MDLEGEDVLVAMAKVVEREEDGEDIGGAEPAAGAGGTEESSVLGDAEMPQEAEMPEEVDDVEAPDEDGGDESGEEPVN